MILIKTQDMAYIKVEIILGLIMLFLFSCCSGNQETVREENVMCHPICGEDYILGGPNAMAILDSILVVVDVKSDSLFHFFNIKAGKYIRKSGVRGHGPSEFTVVSSLNLYDKGSFSFYDINKKKFYKMNFLKNNDVQFTPLFSVDSIFPFKVYPLSNDQFITSGLYDNYRFSLMGSDGRVQSTFGEWPFRDESEKKVSGQIRAQAYMFELAISPSKTKFLASLYSADILAFYQMSADSIHLIKESILSYPDYKYRNNPTNFSGTSKEAPMYYLCAACSDDYIYVLYSGKTFRKHGLGAFGGNEIYVYTWKGDKIAVIKSDKILRELCLSEDGKSMYAIADDPNPVLVSFSLPQW